MTLKDAAADHSTTLIATTRKPETVDAVETTRNQETKNDDGNASATSFCSKNCCFPFLESKIYQTKYRRWVLVVLAFVVVSLAPGLIYGWPALRSRLILEQQEREATTNITNSTNTSNTDSTPTEEQLALMYTVGAWSTQGSRFFLGLLRDRFGTSSIACTSLLGLMAGLLGVGVLASNPGNHIAGLSVSLFFIGLGSGAQLCVQPVAGLFPNHMGIVLAGLSGAFQVSGLVFLILTSNNGSNILLPFGIFAASIFLLMLVSAILLPTGTAFVLEPPKETESVVAVNDIEEEVAAKSNNDDVVDESKEAEQQSSIEKDISTRSTSSLNASMKSNRSSNAPIDMSGLLKTSDSKISDSIVQAQDQITTNDKEVDKWDQMPLNKKEVDTEATIEKCISSPPSENDDDPTTEVTTAVIKNALTLQTSELQTPPPTAWQQIKTAEYLLLVGWFCVGIVPMQYYVGILGYQFEELGDTNQKYQDLFSYIFAGAAVTAPLAGYIADQHGLGVTQGLVTFILAIPFGLLAAGNYLPLSVQVVGLVGYGIGRMGIFGLYFSNIGKRFGYTNYGTLAGLGLIVTAIVSLLQYPLIAWSVKGHSTLVNILLVVALLVQAPYFVWLQRREKQTSSHPTTKRAKNESMARVTIFRSSK